MAVAHWIKVTLGITAWSPERVRIVRGVRDLDVDSSYPFGASSEKGSAVRRVKGYASWVQYDVSQYGPYLRRVT